MKFLIKGALLAIPMLALATSAFAQARPVGLSDSQEPGSVIIFPKFINMPAVTVDGQVVPRTEISARYARRWLYSRATSSAVPSMRR